MLGIQFDQSNSFREKKSLAKLNTIQNGKSLLLGGLFKGPQVGSVQPDGLFDTSNTSAATAFTDSGK